MTTSTGSAPWLLYDGQCPFCTRFVRLLRLRETMPGLRLLDARAGGPELEQVRAAGLDIDEGMVLALDGELHHADRCLHLVSLMSTRSGTFNRFIRWLFSSPTRSAALYPVLRAGRRITLLLLGRGTIGGHR